MRIPLTELNRPKTLTVRGDEEWLGRLYADFPLGKDQALTGELKIKAGEGGEVTVKGHVEFAPKVACGRCEKTIAWPLTLEVDTRFLPERGPETKRDITLTESDLDSYFIEMGAVDLEQALTDVVQTALPSSLVRANEDGDECVVCHADLTKELVFGVGKKAEEKPASPFAALKDLKLKN